MKSNYMLRNAVRLALASGAAAAFVAPNAIAQEGEEEARELDRVQVTGSRIQRTDIEGALPVTTIDREQIELSGESSAADLIRNLSFNSAGSFRPQSGSSAQSFAGVSLRGLGESRTLLLIDGKRLPKAPNVGSSQDLNSIPLAAVERIEILSDGASAVYGSDAIAGVINVVTRKDFEGAEIMYGTSNPAREGGDTEEFSALMGISSERGQLMAGISMNERDIVFQRDRPWSQGGASVFSNNFWEGIFTGSLQHPEFGASVPGEGCTGDGFTRTDAGADSFCFYDFTLQAADEASIKNSSLFVRGRYDINFDWSAFMNASVSRVESFGRYAPVPSSPWPGGLPQANAGDPNHPATAPSDGGLNPNWDDPYYQQFDGQDLFFTHRFAALGPRDAEIDSQVYDADIGVQGRAAGWDIEVGTRFTESSYVDLGRNYVVGDLAQKQIDNGNYNIYDPFSVEDDIANQMKTTINRDSVYRETQSYANFGTDVAQLPAGPLSVAFGAEHRNMKYEDIYDALSEGGQVVGSAGSSASGGRDADAMYFETLVPLLENLEMNIAGRYDDYSDYGSDTSPKISFRYQPIQEVTLRASYGEGFRAPPLNILTQKPAFSAAPVVHAPTADQLGVDPGDSVQITTYSIANPDLESENSEQFSFGVAFQPVDWFSGSVDYFDLQITDQISGISAQQVVNCLMNTAQNCPPGLSVFDENAGFVQSRSPDPAQGLGMAFDGGDPNNDPILFGQTGSTNLGSTQTTGIDLNLTTNFDFGEAGRLRNNLQATYVNEYIVDSGDDVAGNSGLPQTRATLSNVYGIADFDFSWNINYIGPQDTSLAAPDPDPGVKSWTTHDVQGNWYTPWDSKVTVGMRNATDEDPPLDDGASRGFNFDLYDGYGRITYLRYTQSF